MNLFWTVLITLFAVLLGTALCFSMLARARDLDGPVWGIEHVLCPILRIVVLLMIVSQIYPVVDGSSSIDFWRTLVQDGLFSDLINLLFFGGLALSFLPLVSHPVIALPVQSLLTVALVFHGQYQEAVPAAALWPSPLTSLKILAYMAVAFFVTRQIAVRLSRWLDQRLSVNGSVLLVSDAIYLALQIPVILIYCDSLRLQLP